MAIAMSPEPSSVRSKPVNVRLMLSAAVLCPRIVTGIAHQNTALEMCTTWAGLDAKYPFVSLIVRAESQRRPILTSSVFDRVEGPPIVGSTAPSSVTTIVPEGSWLRTTSPPAESPVIVSVEPLKDTAGTAAEAIGAWASVQPNGTSAASAATSIRNRVRGISSPPEIDRVAGAYGHSGA